MEVEAPLDDEVCSHTSDTTSPGTPSGTTQAKAATVAIPNSDLSTTDQESDGTSSTSSTSTSCGSSSLSVSGTGAQSGAVESEQSLVQAVGALPVYSGELIAPTRFRYDCILVQPREEMTAVRLEGRVQAPRCGSAAVAPLAGRQCALFSTSVVELRLDGVQAPPVSFHSVSLDFELELVSDGRGAASATRIHIRAGEVALFGMVSGRHKTAGTPLRRPRGGAELRTGAPSWHGNIG